MVRHLTLSIDAMGADGGPAVVVGAVARVRLRHPTVRYILHGDEAQLAPLLKKHLLLGSVTDIRHTPAFVRMDEKPSYAVRRGRNTSMWRAIECVTRGEAGVVVSAGNTGALMAMGMVQLGLIEGIDRPAIAALWPTMHGQTIVLDVGANVDCDTHQLVDFAVMGAAFAREILGIERPAVALLNIGEEDVKGVESVKRAAQILRGTDLPFTFRGFVEGNDISSGKVDVVVTDGYTGNVALKTAEGTAKLVGYYLKTALKRSLLGRIGGLIASAALGTLRKKMDPRSANGGVFLGLNGAVVKAHGGSDAIGFAAAADLAIDMARSDVLAKISADRAGIREPESSGPAEAAAS